VADSQQDAIDGKGELYVFVADEQSGAARCA